LAVGYETLQVNSQLINVAPSQGYTPLTFGAQYTGPGYWPRNGVYNVPPIVAPGAGPAGGVSAAGQISGATPVPSAGAMKSNGGVNWMHPTKSPALMAVGFLALGLFMLHKVHFRE